MLTASRPGRLPRLALVWLLAALAVLLWGDAPTRVAPLPSEAEEEGKIGEKDAGSAGPKAAQADQGGDAAKGGDVGDKKAQTPEEADRTLANLMKGRRGVRGVTARGETIADATPFKATPRKDNISKYPCTKCHDNQFVDRRVRRLEEEHADLAFDHGGGRFWCYDACHKGTDMDNLVSLRGRPIDYDESYKLCGQCHFERQKDWYFGGHGKRQGAWDKQREIPLTAGELLVKDRERIGVWRGKRVIFNCTVCHDAHSPSIKAFEPSPPPKVRAGLSRRPTKPELEPQVWQRPAEQRKRQQ